MPRAKQKPAAHWLRIEPSREDRQDEILDRVERWHKLDVVLAVHGLHCDEMHRIDTPKCWCADPAEITQPSLRMVRGNRAFRCPIHDKEISIRRALDPLMKTRERRAALLEEHPALKGIRDGLFSAYFCFEAGENYVKRSINAHQPTALSEVSPSKTKPLRGVVIEAINFESAERAFSDLDETAPWRTSLEALLNASCDEVRTGWHGARLTSEEQHRRDISVQREQHRAHQRMLLNQAKERLDNEIKLIE